MPFSQFRSNPWTSQSAPTSTSKGSHGRAIGYILRDQSHQDFFTILFQREKSDNFHVTASLGRQYILRQPQLMFEKLSKEETAKVLREKIFKRNLKIYFAVGYRTLLDARLSQKEQHNTEMSGRIRALIGSS